MKISHERESFKLRLQQALRNAEYSAESPTELAREFNARFDGSSITVHAARKWLVAEAIPTQDKMRALASWLGVAVEWLRFGGDEGIHVKPSPGVDFNGDDRKLAADVRLLSGQDQKIVREIIRMLSRPNR